MRVATVLSEDERKAQRKAYDAARYAANPGKNAVNSAAYRAANPGYMVAYRAENKEKSALRQRAYRAVNRAKYAALRAAYRAANPEKIAVARRAAHQLRKYGLTVEQYDAMLTKQNGTCDICNLVCLTGKRLAVDHCHDTKVVRGLLCANCNMGNGSLKESPKNLAASLVYLAKHGKALTTEEVDELTRDLHHYTKD